MTKYLINLKYAWNKKKPRLMWRLVKTYLGILFLGKRPLRYVDFSIGNKCNIRCPHCFANNYRDGEDRITPNDLNRAVTQAMDLGAVNVSLQGGEAMIYEDLKEYVFAARPQENIISITTNGTLIEPKICEEFKSWGVDILTISIDEFRPYLANPDKIMMKALIARNYGLKVTIGTVVTHEHFENKDRMTFMVRMIQFATEKKILLNLILACPSGEWKEDADKYLLTDQDLKWLREWTKKYTYVRTDMDSTWGKRECPAGSEILFVKSDGQVSGCPFVPIYVGNIKNQTLDRLRYWIDESEIYHKDRCVAGSGEFRERL